MSFPVKVCWFGIYNPQYPRNDILMSGLRENGVEIVECHADWRSRTRYLELCRKFRSLDKRSFDVVYAAYPATLPVMVAKLMTRKPVVMDAFYGMYDAVVNDRHEIPWYHPRALRLWLLDALSVFFADYLVVDTAEHGKFWSAYPLVTKKKIRVIPVGAQTGVYFPKPIKKDKDTFLVSFHGFFIPLQGVDKIVEAANLLRDDPAIRFRLIGSGQLSKRVVELIQKYGLTSIEQIPRVSPQEVNDYSQEADVILGIFGDTRKAYRVVPNKVYEGLALKKAVITMDSPAEREFFTDDEIMLVANTPRAIADAILSLKNDRARCIALAECGHRAILEKYSPQPLGLLLRDFFQKIIGTTRPRVPIDK